MIYRILFTYTGLFRTAIDLMILLRWNFNHHKDLTKCIRRIRQANPARNGAGESMQEIVVTTRVDFATHEHLLDLARQMNIPKSAAVRMMLKDGLAQYDRRFDVLTERMDRNDKMLEQVYWLVAGSVVGPILPPGKGGETTVAGMEEFRTSLSRILHWALQVKDAVEAGQLTMEELRVLAK
jgi:antitoxin component of RelBE/YafQ-DinJ toxin-antitoxin module